MSTTTKETKPIIEVDDTLARRLKAFARHKRQEKLMKDRLEKERDALLAILGNDEKIIQNNGQKLASVLNIDKTYVDAKKLKETFAEVFNRVKWEQTEIQLRTH